MAEYADVPAGFTTTPQHLAVEMQKAMFGADATVVQTQQRDVVGYASVENVSDLPARTRTNRSVFEMTAHTESDRRRPGRPRHAFVRRDVIVGAFT